MKNLMSIAPLLIPAFVLTCCSGEAPSQPDHRRQTACKYACQDLNPTNEEDASQCNTFCVQESDSSLQTFEPQSRPNTRVQLQVWPCGASCPTLEGPELRLVVPEPERFNWKSVLIIYAEQGTEIVRFPDQEKHLIAEDNVVYIPWPPPETTVSHIGYDVLLVLGDKIMVVMYDM